MKLSDASALKLIPTFMQQDAAVRGLANGVNPLIRSPGARTKQVRVWDQIDTLTAAQLDELAWELNVPWYSTSAPIETKRAVIKSSDLVYSQLGTRAAVEQLVTDYFGAAEVKEWYEYGGTPAHFKIITDNADITSYETGFLRMLAYVKRASAVLDAVRIDLTGTAQLGGGMAMLEFTREIISI